MTISKKHFPTDPTEGLPTLPDGVMSCHGRVDGTGKRVGIVAARFNIRLTAALVSSTVDALVVHGVRPEDVEVVWVPGSFELPLALQRLARRGAFDVLIPCGVVVEGETRHAGLILSALASAFTRLSLDLNCPVIDAVVSARTMEQAEARCLGGPESRGAYAARAALETSSLFDSSP